MCFGTATARADDRPETDCNVIAVRLLAIVVFEPVLSPTESVSCLLITLYVRVFWLKNDGAAARIARTVLWLSRRRDEAVRILCLVPISGEMLLQLREDSRARVARTCAADVTDRVQQWLRCSLNVHGSEDGMRMQAAMRTSRVFAQICARHWNRRTRLSIQVL